MILNLIFSRLEHEGYKIVNSIDPVDVIVSQKIAKNAFPVNSKSQDQTLLQFNHKFLYTVVFKYQDNPGARPNLYGLHLLCKQKVLGIEKVLDQLSRQFEDCGIQNLQADQLKILRDSLNKRVSNITLSFNENSCDMDINWGEE